MEKYEYKYLSLIPSTEVYLSTMNSAQEPLASSIPKQNLIFELYNLAQKCLKQGIIEKVKLMSMGPFEEDKNWGLLCGTNIITSCGRGFY